MLKLRAPKHQVAGHAAVGGKLGPLIDGSGRFYKPLQGDERGSHEADFYESFSSNPKIPTHIHKFFPRFYGTQLVEASDGSGLKPHLVLEDIDFGRANPSVIDVKLGSRTWPPHAPEDYVQKCLKKDRESSSISLGFRLSGVQIFEGQELGFWRPEDRSSVQSLSADEIKAILKKYVSAKDSVDCALASVVYGGSNGVLSQLLELKKWFEDQTVYHFYSCSILATFEKDLALDGKNPKAEIKLVDFAHVVEGNGVIDHNVLGGLCSFIKFVSDIVGDESINGVRTKHARLENVIFST